MSLTKFGGLRAHGDKVTLHYVFDFDDSETVVFIGAGPFPGRVFVLRFWRHAKDGVMHLLGYKKQGHWRDPTLCYPDSYVRYYRPQPPLAHSPHEQPQDTTYQPAPIEQLAYRVPLVELEPGVWELPTLKGQPIHMIARAQNFSRLPKPPQTKVKSPPLSTPIQKIIEFVPMSAHFQHQLQADKELSSIVKVMRQFPQLRVTIQGNLANSLAPANLFGFGWAARADQNKRFDPVNTRWPNEFESYSSNGQVMDNRARSIQQYLTRNGINPRRITTQRGQYLRTRTVTIIFSN